MTVASNILSESVLGWEPVTDSDAFFYLEPYTVGSFYKCYSRAIAHPWVKYMEK